MAEITAHQAKYFAYELTRRFASDDRERVAGVLLDAQVDLNPHQVDAALFAFQSPFSKGAILADEVGLGKTVEAGLVIAQRWAEGMRRILVICPASLRKQWAQELEEKFFLPTQILEARSFNQTQRDGTLNPFHRQEDSPVVLICSYPFGARKSEDLMMVPWDLVVLDEAHRLRNVYKPNNKVANTLKTALSTAPKLLLTATPLQNSLMELYGLVSIVDDYAFGDAKAFRARYARLTGDEAAMDLKARLAPICHRTLRRQVLEYINYTNRVPLTREFYPGEDEQRLYDLVSEYLRRPNLQALPASQRTLMVLIMRKLLASSTFAIAGALGTLVTKLEGQLKDAEKSASQDDEDVETALGNDFDALAELTDEWPAPDEDADKPSQADVEAISTELRDLRTLRDLAVSIAENAKGTALLSAVEAGFDAARLQSSAEKVLIFTESRRTQEYLVRLLTDEGYGDDIVLFNGSNTDASSKAIYEAWLLRHRGTARVTGSRTADMRAALVDNFRDHAKIMIATEAAAEGINLQFCSVVVNYDLPWNPQRIEQRIGRCHRYGQKSDVVVINFLNKANAADQRVYELLSEKFSLFSGVFGASDEVLGTVESGVDFEKRIVDIYQRCRTSEAITEAFDQLRAEMDEQVGEAMEATRTKLLENFDAEVHDRLRVNLDQSEQYVGKAQQMLWDLSRHELANHASFSAGRHSFDLTSVPSGCEPVAIGHYELGRPVDDEDASRYRLGHPLAQYVLAKATTADTGAGLLTFEYSNWAASAIALEPLVGREGWLTLSSLAITGIDAEDHLLWAGAVDGGNPLTEEQLRRLMTVPAVFQSANGLDPVGAATSAIDAQRRALLKHREARQAGWFDAELDKLDKWAEDKRTALKSDLRETDDLLKESKRAVRQSSNLPEKLGLQREVTRLERQRDDLWRSYDEAAREVEETKEKLIDDVESRLGQTVDEQPLFTARWKVI